MLLFFQSTLTVKVVVWTDLKPYFVIVSVVFASVQ